MAAVLVASDSRSAGARTDATGPAARAALEDLGFTVAEVRIVPDDEALLAGVMDDWAAREDIALIIAAGGTGLAPRDVTPEATRQIIEREATGIAEYLRAKSLEITPRAALSRGVAGVANRTLIINTPGSPKAVAETIGFLADILPHAIETVTGRAVECAR